MGKGDKQKGNKEAKKPKKEKPKTIAAADAGTGRPGIVVSGKKVK
ncbi:MAG: hypothetical protein WBA67_13305 [Jannaschia sp.]